MKDLLAYAASLAGEYLEGVGERHVGATASYGECLRLLSRDLPEEGAGAKDALDELVRGAGPGLVASAGRRYFGFVTGGSLPASVAADVMTTAWDQNAVLAVSSPAAAAVEEVVAGWVLSLLGLPEGAGVGFVTGCQMANFTCLAAARHQVLRDVGHDVERKGLFGAPAVTVIAGKEAHATLFAAVRMLGLGQDRMLLADVDDQGRMRPSALKAILSGVSGPAIVCAQAGNVNSGAFDPFDEIIPIAKEHGCWVHVDGAFGLWAAACDGLKSLTRGVAGADSWATDAHKWLNVPYDSGLAIVANTAAHRASMTIEAPYYVRTQGEVREPNHWVPESSRRARGFPLYAALLSIGRRGVADLVGTNCRQARLMAELLDAEDGVEIMNRVVLNQVVARFLPRSGDADAFTRRVVAAVQDEGTCWAGGTNWHGAAGMRISVSSWATTDDDIRRSADAILATFRKQREE